MQTPVTTAAKLRDLLNYDPETGVFTWRFSRPNVKGGSVEGTTSVGLRFIKIDGRQYSASRLAWLYVHGRWPTGLIRHKNDMAGDNRIANLQKVTCRQIQRNTRRRSDNSSGFKGVARHTRTGRWSAQIWLNGRTVYLGLFDTPEQAHAAYCKAATEHFCDFARFE